MFDSLYIGATGMQAQQLHVDTIANNLANLNTVGFKKSRVNFSDLIARELARENSANATSLNGLSAGVAVTGVSRVFDAGDIKKTESAFDLAIVGDGFVELAMADGSRAFTRGGTLKVNRDGILSTQGGQALKPGISIPENAQSLTIQPDGRVQIKVATQANPIEVGRLEVVRFTAPTALVSQGDGVFRSSEASGEPIAGRAGEDGLGTFAQGYLEGSNVKLVDEMVSLMVAQRAYEASVKVVQASDEMLGMVNSLRK